MRGTTWSVTVAVAAVAATAVAVVGRGEGPEPAARHDLKALAFMAGCWRQQGDGGVEPRIVEHYTMPLANLMLGTTRYVAGDSATGFELTTIVREGDTVVLTPYPNGVASEHDFRLTRAAEGEAVFESPEHDFPKRIVYRRTPAGDLTARIDAGEDRPDGAVIWTMAAASCGEPVSPGG